METSEISACLANGSVTHLERDDSTGRIEWTEHPKFKGIYLKHLVRGEDTEGYRDMLRALSNEKVRFLLVGAYAMEIHGYPRRPWGECLQINS